MAVCNGRSSLTNRLGGVDAKIYRARQHLAELERNVAALENQTLDITVLYCEIDTRHGILALEPHFLGRLATVVGDAIGNLRMSLDHLFSQLIEINGGTSGHGDHFPIGENAQHFSRRIREARKKVGATASELLENTEAYNGGTGNGLWQISEMNNADKHRLLLPIVSHLDALQVDFGAMMRDDDHRSVPSLKVQIRPKREIRERELERGAIILRITDFPPDVDVSTLPVLTVLFHENGIVEDEPVLPTLENWANLVEETIRPFRSLFVGEP